MALRNVAKTFSLDEQRIEINELAADVELLTGSSTTLSSFSVTTNAVGTSALVYDNTTGVYTYTPPDLSGFLLSSSAAGGITSADITNWDTAYGWGDHSQEGYLVNGTLASTIYRGNGDFKLIGGGSQTSRPYIHLKNASSIDLDILGAASDSGGVNIDSRGSGTVKLKDGGTLRLETSNTGVTISGVLSATGGDSDYWNTAYGWGDHSLVGYLTNADTTDWDTAYGWGDHSQAGYLTSVALNNNDVSDVIVTTPSLGDLLSWNGSSWVNIATPETTFISDTPPTTPNPGDLWWESDSGRLKVYYQDVDTSQWVDAFPPLANPFNVTAADAQNWNTAYGWGDHSGAGYLTTEADTLDTVTGRGATTTNTVQVGQIDIGSTSQTILPSGTNDVTFQNTISGGAIFLRAAGDVEIQSYQGSSLLKTDTGDITTGGIKLYYATGLTTEVERIATTSTGVTITGDLSIPNKLIHDGDIDTHIAFDTDVIKLSTAGSERITIGASGQLGLGGSNYGAIGEVLTSNGPSAAPSWQSGGSGGAGGLSVSIPHGATDTTKTFVAADANSISGTVTDRLRTYVLPQGSTLTLGDQFYIFDIGDDANSSGNAATYNISITPHSGDRIQGAAADTPYIIASSMGSVRLIWMGSTPQWRVFQ